MSVVQQQKGGNSIILHCVPTIKEITLKDSSRSLREERKPLVPPQLQQQENDLI